MNLIVHQAETVQAKMPVAKQVQGLLQQSMKKGLGDHDMVAIALAIKEDN